MSDHPKIIKELLEAGVQVGLTLKKLAGHLHVVYSIPGLGWLEPKILFSMGAPQHGFVVHYDPREKRTALVSTLEGLVRVHFNRSKFSMAGGSGVDGLQPAPGWGELYERFGLAEARTETYYVPVSVNG